jgi:hypothetical protein
VKGQRKIACLAVLALLLALVFTTPAGAQGPDPDQPGDPSGNGIEPVLVPDNPNCESLYGLYGFKVDGAAPEDTYTLTSADGELTGGAPEDPANSVTIYDSDGQLFSWNSTLGIDAVIVKASDNADAFVYDPPAESTGDTDLHGPVKADGTLREISHVEFCYDYEQEPEPGTITIIKAADPEDDTPFSFTGDLGAFTLMDPSDNTKTFSDLDAGSYTITEAETAGWDLDEITCTFDPANGVGSVDLANRQVTVDLAEGQTIECTFTNSKEPPQPGSLQVTKTVDWGSFPPDTSQGFEICIQGPSYPEPNCMTADYDGATLTWNNLTPGDYTVTETDPGVSWIVNVSGSPATVAAGQTAQATVSNTFDPRGTIIVNKIVDLPEEWPLPPMPDPGCLCGLDKNGQCPCELPPFPEEPCLPLPDFEMPCIPSDGPGSPCLPIPDDILPCLPLDEASFPAIPWDEIGIGWEFNLSGDALDEDFQLPLPGGSKSFQVNWGSYAVEETPMPFFETSVVCDNGAQGGSSVEIDVAPGETVQCTFTNELVFGWLKVVKVVQGRVPVDPWVFGVETPLGFTFVGSLPPAGMAVPPPPFEYVPVPVGEYTIMELPKPNYVSMASCTPGGESGSFSVTFTVDPNEMVTCTFLNIFEKPTAVDLASLGAQAGPEGVVVAWETNAEIDNAGFNVYRGTSLTGPWVQINDELIVAQGGTGGGSYSVVDTPGYGTFYYQLEDVDYNGIATMHGPAPVELGSAIRAPWFRPLLPDF